MIDAGPRVRDHASSRSGCFKHAGRRGKSNFGHGLSVDVKHHARRTINSVVVGAAYVADPAYIAGQRPATPTFSTEHERKFRRQFGGRKEKLVYPLLSIWQPVADEGEITNEVSIRRYRIVGVGIKPVGNGQAVLRSQTAILLDYR